MKNIYARVEKLTNVAGRLAYTNAPDTDKKKENVCATFDTASQSAQFDKDFWKQLATYNQAAFQKSGNNAKEKNKCCEAREIVLEVPNELYGSDHNVLAKLIAEQFKQKYKVECNVALHLNERKTNFHAHIIFSERQKNESSEVKIAPRNLFFDEYGKRRYKKSEILNEDGTLRDGCKIIKKGSEINESSFSEKNAYFKSKKFTKEIKDNYVSLWNKILQEDRYQIFDPNDVFLATKKLHKNYTPEIKERIKQENTMIYQYNESAKKILDASEEHRDVLREQKKEILRESFEEARATGSNFSDVLYNKILDALESMRNLYIKITRSIDYLMKSAKKKGEMSNQIIENIKQKSKKEKER